MVEMDEYWKYSLIKFIYMRNSTNAQSYTMGFFQTEWLLRTQEPWVTK